MYFETLVRIVPARLFSFRSRTRCDCRVEPAIPLDAEDECFRCMNELRSALDADLSQKLTLVTANYSCFMKHFKISLFI